MKKKSTFYSSSKAETIINESNNDDVFESVYRAILSNIQKSLGKGLSWIVDSVADHNINISKYKHLSGSSYVKLPNELVHPRKILINIQDNNDNDFFEWCFVRYLHPANHNPVYIRKVTKFLTVKRTLRILNFPSKLRKRIALALVFLVMKAKKHIIYSLFLQKYSQKTF